MSQIIQKGYRCRACGNRTRFDVTVTSRIRAFYHYSLGGELALEDPEVLAETVESVVCRWCGNGSAVEALSGDADRVDLGDAGFGGDAAPDLGADGRVGGEHHESGAAVG